MYMYACKELHSCCILGTSFVNPYISRFFASLLAELRDRRGIHRAIRANSNCGMTKRLLG